MELQQTNDYAGYIRSLGWIVERVDGSYVFIKPFPFIGGLAKLQRSASLPKPSLLLPLLQKHHVKTLAVEPDSSFSQKTLTAWTKKLNGRIKINTDFFLPTKTIRVDTRPSVEAIFDNFTEAKRRAVRKAGKNGIHVNISRDIDTFLRLKGKSAGFLGFITTAGMKKLWESQPETNTAVLMAYKDTDPDPLAGIMLIFCDRIAYYWLAGALKEGKKLFAPTLLVYEALKLAKSKKCTALDFVGVWDERLPSKNLEWKGFTKFKEGFGGQPLYYPIVK